MNMSDINNDNKNLNNNNNIQLLNNNKIDELPIVQDEYSKYFNKNDDEIVNSSSSISGSRQFPREENQN